VQPAQGARVAADVLLVLALELLEEVVHLEDALLNGEQRHIERAATKVEDEHVLLARAAGLLVEAVGDGSGRPPRTPVSLPAST
jgi:hypothetical protein